MGTGWSPGRFSLDRQEEKNPTWPTLLQPSDARGCGTYERHPSNGLTKTRWFNFAWTIDKKKKRFFFQSEIQLDPPHPFSQQPGTGPPLWRITILFVFFFIVVSRCGPTAEKTSRTCVVVKLQQRFAARRRQCTTKQPNETNKTQKSFFFFCNKCLFSLGLHWFYLVGLGRCFLDLLPSFETIRRTVFLCSQASGHSSTFIELCVKKSI